MVQLSMCSFSLVRGEKNAANSKEKTMFDPVFSSEERQSWNHWTPPKHLRPHTYTPGRSTHHWRRKESLTFLDTRHALLADVKNLGPFLHGAQWMLDGLQLVHGDVSTAGRHLSVSNFLSPNHTTTLLVKARNGVASMMGDLVGTGASCWHRELVSTGGSWALGARGHGRG
jgi:hypothetical protein